MSARDNAVVRAVGRHSGRAILGVLSTALVLGLAAPAAAQANVYCVDLAGGDCTHFPAGVQAALNDADANPGLDTVRLGPNTYPAPLSTGFVYAGTTDPVSIVGSGQGQTTIAVPAPGAAPGVFTEYAGLSFTGSTPGSSVSDLSVTLPVPPGAAANQIYRGIYTLAPNSSIARVTVTNGGGDTNAVGMAVNQGGVVSDVSVSMTATNAGVTGISNLGNANTVNPLLVERAEVEATRSILYSSELGALLTVRRSTLRPEDFSAGLEVTTGNAAIANSVIDLGASENSRGIAAENLNNNDDPINVDADHVTIVGGGASSIGARTQGNSTASGENATLDLTNSVISGPEQSIVVRADNGETATVTTSYSNYVPVPPADVDSDIDDAGATGTATLTESSHTNLAPGFVNPAMGDFHLAPGSPLIDAGDPVPPAPGTLDLDGDARALSAASVCNGPVAGRRDIGADEFVAAAGTCPPVTNPPAKKKKCKKGKKKKKKCRRKKR